MQDSNFRVVKDEVIGEKGVVCAETPLSAAAGAEMFEKGGNAVDAAVAATFTAGVVEPASSGLGGNSNVVMYLAEQGRAFSVCSGTQAPNRASADMFELLEEQGGYYNWRLVKNDANMTGHLSSIAPSFVLGLEEAHRAGGHLPWAEVLEPAIRYAVEGFEVDGFMCVSIATRLGKLLRFPVTRAVLTVDGLPPQVGNFYTPGTRIVNSELADSLRAIASEGSRVLTHGYIARAIAEEMRQHGGLIDEEDMAALGTEVRPARMISYRGYQIGTVAEFVWQLEVLNILEGCDLPSLEADCAERLHLLTEAFRCAFADWFAFVGDPNAQSVPVDILTSKAYGVQRCSVIQKLRSAGPGSPGNPYADESEWSRDLTSARGYYSENTTNVTAGDNEGNLMTINSSLCGGFGSGVMVPGTGILLNNYMSGFDPEPGHPNSIGPGKEGVGLGANLVVMRDGKGFAAIGAPGARRASGGTMQSLLNVLDHGMGIQEAIAAPRIFCEDTGDLSVDARLDPKVVAELESRGHSILLVEDTIFSPPFGRPLAVLIDPDSGHVHGGVQIPAAATAIGVS